MPNTNLHNLKVRCPVCDKYIQIYSPSYIDNAIKATCCDCQITGIATACASRVTEHQEELTIVRAVTSFMCEALKVKLFCVDKGIEWRINIK